MKKQSVFFLLLMAATVFISCGDDDEMIDVKDLPYTGYERGRAYVDLGLPSGLKWATCNVGAENPWEYGDYFAWGETTPKSSYEYSNYLDGRCTRLYDLGTDIDLLNGLTDITGTQYDAARANMGGSWRMPTTVEQQELIKNCYWKWTDSYNGKGVKGYIVYKVKYSSDKGKKKFSRSSYSLSDTHIFLPAAGGHFYESGGFGGAGFVGNYMSSSCDTTDHPWWAYGLNFESPGVQWGFYSRISGLSVRGVCK